MVNNSNQPHSNNLKQINKQLKSVKMKTKIKFPYGIKQPTTVEEFRNNLRNYYVTVGNGLYTMKNGVIPLDKISSFSDIYEITKTGNRGTGGSPSISPKVILKKDLLEWMKESFQIKTFYDYFLNEEYYEVIENQDEFMKRGDPRWYTLDNQIMREFYIMTLGDYCGY